MLVSSLSLGTLGELRGTNHPKHGNVWSIRDFINKLKKKLAGDKYGTMTWNDMVKGPYANELVGIFYQLIIPGSQGRPTPCANIVGLQTILGLLPGKIAEEYRIELRDIFNRVITGDTSLIKVIEHNATTATSVQVLLRNATKRSREESGEMQIETPEEKKFRHMKILAEITQMEAETRRINQETTQMQKDNIVSIEQHYTRLCVGGVIDDRARLLFKDRLLNVETASQYSGQLAITNGAAGEPAPDERSLTISSFASELKIRMNNAQGIQAGRIMAKLYRDKYGNNPTSHEQFVDGAVRAVKSYTRVDSDLMEQAIREATNRL